MNDIQLVLALLVGVVALSTLARRIHVPYPIVLVLGGLLLGAISDLPQVKLAPDVVLLLFLPPLVYATAWQTSVRDLRANLRSILLLSIGLVVFTVLVVANVSSRAIAELGVLPAFVLGAVVSPTDTVAAEAIITRLSMPRRIVTVLEGESLINDATGLVAYTFAVDVAINGAGSFSAPSIALAFVVASVGGVAIGLAVGIVAAWAQRRIGDVPTGIMFSLLVPYAAYLPSQLPHLPMPVSGVLAAVTAGLYGGWKEPTTLSSDQRLQAFSVWSTVTFIVNGLIFILVGLQLRPIGANLLDPRQYPGDRVPYSPATLVWYAALVALLVIVVRILWVFPGTYLPRLLSRRLRARDPYPGWRNVVVVAWTGMRGGLSLAAALALPARGDLSRSQVNLITFLVFGVILGTLVVQGLTLPVLIVRLRLSDDSAATDREEATARLAAMRAVLAQLSDAPPMEGASPEGVEHLRAYYEKRADHLASHLDGGAGDGVSLSEGADPVHDLRQLKREMLGVERRTVIGLRNRSAIGDETMRRIEHDLDLEEARS